jgi:hypothetical protein
MLGHSYCGYLIYLARSVDGPAVHFLETFGESIDVETGEALAFIVLLDTAVLHGQYDPSGQLHKTHPYLASSLRRYSWPGPPRDFNEYSYRRLPTIDVAETTSGGQLLTNAIAHRFGSIPTEAFYRADPEWSLKFADHIGLHRAFLPCIVAMDDPGASDEDRCAVISLADGEAAWNALTDAISNYVAEPDTQRFITAAERVRSAERELRTCANARNQVANRLSALQRLEAADALDSAVRHGVAELRHATQILGSLPSAPDDVLGWAAGLEEPDRQTVASAAQRTGIDHAGAATLLRLLERPDHASATRNIRRTHRRLRNTWLLNPTPDNPHLTKMIAVELAAAQSYLNRSPDDLPRLIDMTEAADRKAFLSLVETRASFPETELADCWSYLDKFVRPQIPGVVRDEQIAITQEGLSAAEQRRDEAVAALDAAKSALKATPMTSFVPHVAHAADTMPADRDIAKRNRPSRTAIAAGRHRLLGQHSPNLAGLRRPEVTHDAGGRSSQLANRP